MTIKLWIATPAIALAILWGCYAPVDIPLHEPGVYKGKQDPLLGKLRQPELQQQLVERFKMVQTDR
jgi:hypothetical protein